LKPNLISAHPQARGGWKSHDADLTYLHVDETINVARETYRFLDRFLIHNTQFRRHPSEPWSTVEPIVRAFAMARGPSEKAAWATQHIPEQQARQMHDAVRPGGRLRLKALSPPLSNSRDSVARLARDDQTALRAIDEFLRDWLVRRDVDAAMKYVDLGALASQFVGDRWLSTPAAIEEWCGKFLTIQLTDDHAAVNEAGRGDSSHPRYGELPRRSAARARRPGVHYRSA
jgi:hypothetical protein